LSPLLPIGKEHLLPVSLIPVANFPPVYCT
jgi:hypothetical protein